MHAISRDHMKQPPLKRLLVCPNHENIALFKWWDNSSTPNAYNQCFLSSREIHDTLQYQEDVEDQPVLVFVGTHRRTNKLFRPQNSPNMTELSFHRAGGIRRPYQPHCHKPRHEWLLYTFGVLRDQSFQDHLCFGKRSQLRWIVDQQCA